MAMERKGAASCIVPNEREETARDGRSALVTKEVAERALPDKKCMRLWIERENGGGVALGQARLQGLDNGAAEVWTGVRLRIGWLLSR
jgi:hypothetical protein